MAQEPATDESRTSYALGINFGSNLKAQGVDVNLDTVRKGIEDALAGKPQLDENQMRDTFNELLIKIVTEESPPVRSLVPDLDAGLAEIIDRAGPVPTRSKDPDGHFGALVRAIAYLTWPALLAPVGVLILLSPLGLAFGETFSISLYLTAFLLVLSLPLTAPSLLPHEVLERAALEELERFVQARRRHAVVPQQRTAQAAHRPHQRTLDVGGRPRSDVRVRAGDIEGEQAADDQADRRDTAVAGRRTFRRRDPL